MYRRFEELSALGANRSSDNKEFVAFVEVVALLVCLDFFGVASVGFGGSSSVGSGAFRFLFVPLPLLKISSISFDFCVVVFINTVFS